MAALRYMSGRELATRLTERGAKLEWIEHQVASGELVIRQATPEERARYGIPSGGADAANGHSRARRRPARG